MKFCLVWGIVFPFLGTVLGSALVFFLRWDSDLLRRMFSGAAAGIMGAASVFGLLVPALERSWTALLGVGLGACFLLLPAGMMRRRGWLIVLAVVLHNIPEGMAAGLSFGGWLSGVGVVAEDALAVGVGIGLQNLPDGAMVAMPLRQQGMSRAKAFAVGAASGLVEPLAAVCMMVWAGRLIGVLPVLMGFAAGAMGFVVAMELIPAMEIHKGKPAGAICFGLGLAGMLAVV